ncbi:MAG: LytTR family DNA-binding domain-containing protein [Clostridiales bacterium]|nr:LytTR family DNA-binding domain-containing protein [Clostridiales bacterium]
MKLNIALCDDDHAALPIIAGAVESAFRAQGLEPKLHRFHSGSALLDQMEREQFQIVLLDIDMPELDGIQVGKKIRERDKEVQIIYVSECESRVFESFQVQPLGFVRKSNFFNDISAVVQLYLQTCANRSKAVYVELPAGNTPLILRCDQIRYIEGSRNEQLVYTTQRTEPYRIKSTMNQLELQLKSYGFLRIHKGYLVNHTAIQRISYTQVILLDGLALPVGRSKLEEVKQAYLALQEE